MRAARKAPGPGIFVSYLAAAAKGTGRALNMYKVRQVSFIAWLISAALAILTAGLVLLIYQNFAQWRAAELRISHAKTAVALYDDVYEEVLRAESSVRAYIITGKPDSLKPFDLASAAVTRDLNVLAGIDRAHAGEGRPMKELSDLVDQRFRRLRDTILQRRTGGFESVRLKVLTGIGTALTANIERNVKLGQEREREYLKTWELEAKGASLQRARLLTIAFLLVFLLVTGALLYSLHSARRRQQAEAQLADEHARLQSVLDSAAHLSVIATDVAGAITVFSRGAERLLGYRSEEMLGRSPELLHLPEEMEEHARALSLSLGKQVSGFEVFVAMARGGSFEHREWTYVRKDGSRVPVELTVTGIKDHEGRLTGFLGMAVDITARRKSQLQMRKLSAAVKASPTSIVITDRDAAIEYANPKFFELTGYSEKEIIGQNPRILSSGRHPKEHYREMWDTLLAGKTWNGEFLNRKKSGELFWEHAAISPVKDPRGDITNFVAVKLDITDSKLAQKEIEKARDAAVELARMKSEFLANMSHEIRTPMNAIIGMGGLLMDTALNDQQRDYVKTMTGAGEALLDIINDILDFSKIESGKMTIENTDFDLAETVESTADLLAARAQAKGLELLCLVDPCVPQGLCGDQGRLRQVLLNLVGNAVKFTEKGEVAIAVRCAKSSEASATLRFEVRDTGIGISEEGRKRLFQTFSQADTSTTRKYGGTGLGLSICKKLVEMMGGEIGVESAPGRGSTFWFTLPFDIRSCSPAPRPPRAEVAGAKTLVVDDNAANREIVGRYLELWKMPFAFAASGEEALAALRKAAAGGDPFRLAVLDMQMPGMDGLMLSRAIGADPAIPPLSRLMLTSLGGILPQPELQAAGVHSCLTKPLHPTALLKAIGAALSGGAPAAPAAPAEPAAETAQAARNPYFRVLVAEDNTVNQKVAVMQLAKLGYEAEVAANGQEALDALKRRPYDLVLMDCQMPEMDGYQATAEIRKLEAEQGLPHIPIVAMTAGAMKTDADKALAAGMDAYLSKPVRIETLAATLERWDAVLDAAAVKALRELAGPENPEFFPGLAAAYLKDLPGRLAAVKAALDAGDAEALRQAAHALKGSSANVGALRLNKICRTLEAAAKAGALPAAAELREALDKAAPAARAALEAAAAGK